LNNPSNRRFHRANCRATAHFSGVINRLIRGFGQPNARSQ
jgi:hypothetical protein